MGDILMTRMIFEDFKLLHPDIKITYACPTSYWDAVRDHPFIDELVDSRSVNVKDYLISYCITTVCGRYENRVANLAFNDPSLPFQDKNRSDIWAEHCGVKLTRHDMHVRLSEEEIAFGKREIKKANNTGRPTIVLCPVSAMEGKNLGEEQMNGTIRELTKMGYFVVCLHNTLIKELKEAPLLTGYTIRQWMGVLNAADYVISVDTSAFHFSGGIGKPLVGVFSWADGLVYGKHYRCVVVQKHKRYTPGWGCGPCFMWSRCTKSPDTLNPRKPCITEITVDDIVRGAVKMFKNNYTGCTLSD